MHLLPDHAWLDFERTHVWHPYAPLQGAVPAVPVRAAHGVRLVLEDGRELIDGLGSWWAAVRAGWRRRAA